MSDAPLPAVGADVLTQDRYNHWYPARVVKQRGEAPAHEFRVQKIGARIRAFKRVGVSGDWKTNTGSAMLEELEPSAAQRAWAEHAASLFGQTLDILTVDTIVEEATGKEWILEVNGTSSGLSPDTEAQDNRDIRDLVVARMSAALCCVAVTKMAEEATDGDGVP